ncbi:MAG TPA: hypothetical protein VGO47_10840, partial [Chlamydiales bacterium]|nr:hypothetical protein [Chlamydiales bacterium]
MYFGDFRSHPQDAIDGGDGDDGDDGKVPSVADAGKGITGGGGGTIDYIIPPSSNGVYVFRSTGGQGGQGGTGGLGQYGGSGGNGADCRCNQHGTGNGSNGGKGGAGGRGGIGGIGGRGGDGGRGGEIFVTYTHGFDFAGHVSYHNEGGQPGPGGSRGPGGPGGVSGNGGNPGQGATHFNCDLPEVHNGLPGGVKPSKGPGDVGHLGPDGTVHGTAGNAIHPIPVDPPSIPGGCNGPTNLGQYASGCAPGLVANGGICTNSPTFMYHCNLFGGYDAGSCGCFGMCDPTNGAGCSPVVVDVLGNGFAMTSAENGVMFDLQGQGTPRQFSWIAANSDDSWLALDRNNNGMI